MPFLTNQASRFLGGGRFAPNKIVGLALWLKADAITGLADGGAITTWTDSSGNGRDATQAVAGAKPTYKTGIFNGKPVARFDGGDVLTNASAQLPLRTRSIFLVLREGAPGDYLGILSLYPASGNDNDSTSGLTINTGTERMEIQAPGFSLLDSSPGAIPLSIYSEIVSASLATLYANGSSIATDLSWTQFAVSSAGGFAVGGRFLSGALSASYRFAGDIAEIIIYDSALSDANRQAVEAYLAAKYGITLA